MKKFEAKTLEEAYALATRHFDCSLTELDCEIVQHPTAGFLGLFAKQAMIVVAPKHPASAPETQKTAARKPSEKVSKKAENPTKKTEKPASKPEKTKSTETEKELSETKPESKADKHSAAQESVLESFFDEADTEASTIDTEVSLSLTENTLQEEIEKELEALIGLSCFDIDVVEVDVIDQTAYIFMDGEDAALLIGKEGYRYNALSYLISNWLKNRYSLYIKLEIAQFLASQQEMIRSYMIPVIEHVEQEGWGRTRALDGILVQIALEQLREEFPNKYVAIKRTRNGDRYVLINEFNKR